VRRQARTMGNSDVKEVERPLPDFKKIGWWPNEIIPHSKNLGGLFLSSIPNSKDCLSLLRSMNIFYILDLTKSTSIPPGSLYTNNNEFYPLNLQCDDCQDFIITDYFERSFSFIEEGRKSKKGVLVHCEAGISRSPVVVVGYLLSIRFSPTLEECFNHTKQCRSLVAPNFGFAKQLALWEKNELKLPHISDFYFVYILETHGLDEKFTPDQLRKATEQKNDNVMEGLLVLLNSEED